MDTVHPPTLMLSYGKMLSLVWRGAARLFQCDLDADTDYEIYSAFIGNISFPALARAIELAA